MASGWIFPLGWLPAENARKRSADAGMVEHLAKPLDLDALAALLARIPARSRPGQ